MDGAVVVGENRATTNSKSLAREPVVESAMLRGTTQESVPQGRELREMNQAHTMVLANKVVVNKVLANQGGTNMYLAKQEVAIKEEGNLDLQEAVATNGGEVVVEVVEGLV